MPSSNSDRRVTRATNKVVPSSDEDHFDVDAFFAETHRGKKPLTRWRRHITGVPLINPFRYDDCLLCTKGFYSDRDLRQHYAKRHALAVPEPTPLPSDLEQLRDCQFYNEDIKSTRCGVCGRKDFADVEELRLHKTEHVPTNFRRHCCQDCGERFLLAEQLKEHERTCECRENEYLT